MTRCLGVFVLAVLTVAVVLRLPARAQSPLSLTAASYDVVRLVGNTQANATFTVSDARAAVFHIVTDASQLAISVAAPGAPFVGESEFALFSGTIERRTIPPLARSMFHDPLSTPGEHLILRIERPPSGEWQLQLTAPPSTTEIAASVSLFMESPTAAALLVAPNVVPIGRAVSVTLAAVSGSEAVTVGEASVAIVTPTGGSLVMTLHDDGVAPDAEVGDGLYSAAMVPAETGEFSAMAAIRGVTPGGITVYREAATLFEVVNVGNDVVAHAGPDQVVRLNSTVMLNGGIAGAPLGRVLQVQWQQIDGPLVTIKDNTTLAASFVGKTAGQVRLRLLVTDGAGKPTEDDVTIVVNRLGDVDGDGDVDSADVSSVVDAGNTTAANANDVRDVNGDGTINGSDINLLSSLCDSWCRNVTTGMYSNYFAEGATSEFFDARIALLNPGPKDTVATLRFLPGSGEPIVHTVPVSTGRRVTVDPKAIAGLEKAEFSTVIESDEPLVVDRTMTWDGTGYGAHSETAVRSPSTTWYLAEGATIGGFDLFYLLQNPAAAPTTVRVRYLRAAGAPLSKTYVLPPQSRTNIWVNTEEFPGLGKALASVEVSAVVESQDSTPIIVERAMYRSNQGRTFNAGHESTGVSAPATDWFLAEGATGSYFDMFVLIANPSDADAQVTVTYLTVGGATYSRSFVARANARSGIWVDQEEFPGIAGKPLADAAVSTTVKSTNGVPVVVERAMWWPGDSTTWHEAHNSAGATATGTQWAVAEGEVGGARDHETYLLIANTSELAGSATVTLMFEDGTSLAKAYALPPLSRTNVAVAADFGAAVAGKRFGAVIESTGTTPAQIVVERAMYSSAGGVRFAAGTNALATKLK